MTQQQIKKKNDQRTVRSCSLTSMVSMSFFTRVSSPLEVLNGMLSSSSELTRDAYTQIYSISRGNMMTPCNTPPPPVVSLEPKAIVPKQMYYFENEYEYSRPLSPFCVKFSAEADNVSVSSSVIDFDRISHENISWTPEPLMPRTFGYDVYGNEIVEKAPPRLSYAFTNASDSEQSIFEKLTKYRAYKEERGAAIKKEKQGNAEQSANTLSHPATTTSQSTKTLSATTSSRSTTTPSRTTTTLSLRDETMENFIRNIKENKTMWKNEHNISVVPRVRRKIEEGSYPNFSVNEDKLPKLLRYTWKGKLGKLKKYLADESKHFKINRQDDQGRTALHYAASWGCKKTMQVLLKIPEIDLNGKDAHDMTPLFKAVQINSMECVKLLIDAGAKVNTTCRDGRTAFDYAIMEFGDRHFDVAECLLKNSGRTQKKTEKDGRMMTYLHKVCLASSSVSVERIVELLIENREDINAVEGKGRTPLMLATIAQRPDIVRCLLRQFADVTIFDDNFKNVLSYGKEGAICYDLLSCCYSGSKNVRVIRHNNNNNNKQAGNPKIAPLEGKATGVKKTFDPDYISQLFLASKYKKPKN